MWEGIMAEPSAEGAPSKGDRQVSTPEALEKYRDVLDRAMRRLVPKQPEGLHRMLRYHLGWVDEWGCQLEGYSVGKTLRPTLCFLACEALGRPWTEAAIVAATLELIHNFSLIHDDIQDGDRERRGRPTVWYLWGVGEAIWAGNAMRVLSDGALNSSVEAADKRVEMAGLLTQASLDMIEGQYMDLEFENRVDVTVDDYLAMIARKTGALIRCAVELGALVATDDKSVIRALSRWGYHVGVAFQVRDDLLGIWGDPVRTGKAAGNDIRRKKKTFPVVYGFAHATGERRRCLNAAYSRESLDDHDVVTVQQVLSAVGADSQAQTLVDWHTDQSLSVLDRLDSCASPWALHQMVELTRYLEQRDR